MKRLFFLITLITFTIMGLFIIGCDEQIPVGTVTWKVEYDYMYDNSNNISYHVFPHSSTLDNVKDYLSDAGIALTFIHADTAQNTKRVISSYIITSEQELYNFLNTNAEPWKFDGQNILYVGTPSRVALKNESYMAGVVDYNILESDAIAFVDPFGYGEEKISIAFICIQRWRDRHRVSDSLVILAGILTHEIGHLRGKLSHLCEEPDLHNDNYCIMSGNIIQDTCNGNIILSQPIKYCDTCKVKLINDWVPFELPSNQTF